jgi:integrase
MSTRTDLMTELEHEMTYYSYHTKEQYRAHVSSYFDWLEKKDRMELWKDRDVLYEYINYLLKKKKVAQSHVNYLIRGPIGCLFRMSEMRIPVKLPKSTLGRMVNLEDRTQFSPDEIISMIMAAKESMRPEWCVYMALSSVYMLRVGEMANIEKKDVHPLKKTILIRTTKGGVLTEHTVPDIIGHYIFSYDFPPISRNNLNGILKEIAAKAGVVVPKRKSWHAIRHGVGTALQAQRDEEGRRYLDDDTIFRFGRWSGSTTMNIYVTPDSANNDERVFKYHPFLEKWGK